MKIHKATFGILMDETRVKNDGTYPIKLRITYKRDRKYYALGYSFLKEDWLKVVNPNPHGNYRNIKLELSEIEKKASQVINAMEENDEEFSFNRFEYLFFRDKGFIDDVYEEFNTKVKELEEAGKVSNATAYKCALKSINSYYKGKQLKFKEISPKSLENYEDWMINDLKNSYSTTSIYLRCLRALFNEQIEKGNVNRESYPFGRHRYIIPSSETRDKGLSKDILKALYEYIPIEFSSEDKAKDLWFFMYLSNGMNVKDMCRLRKQNFNQTYFSFKRAKTEGTSKNVKEINVVLTGEILKIIAKWGNNNENELIFPFFNIAKKPIDERRISQNLTGFINDNMNKIALNIGLPNHITTYSARHSHSNMLKNSGAPIKMIADNLGHSNTLITEKHYLTKFDIEKQREFTDQLLKFNS